jgi:hypothetical protein
MPSDEELKGLLDARFPLEKDWVKLIEVILPMTI